MKSLRIIFCLLFLISTANFSYGENFDSKTEKPLSLNFKNIKVRDFLEIMAELTNHNIIISDNVTGNISIHLNNVSWNQAINTVLMMRGLAKRQLEDVILIAPQTELNQYEQQQLINEPLTSRFIPIHYAQAEAVATMLRNNLLLTKQERMAVDVRTNKIWLEAPTSEIEKINNLIQQLDVPAQQVAIHARIVNIDESFMRELGLKFNTTNNNTNVLKDNKLHMDLPISSNKTGDFTVAIAHLGNDNLLNLQLTALESEGHGKIISDPELITADRQAASIQSGEEIPYQEKTSSGATNVAFKKAVLGLKVTPIIMPNNKIMLQLTINQDKISPLAVNGIPAIQTREVNTQVLVNNGDTIVLGGIYEKINNTQYERLPFLSAIPMIGNLFRHQETKREQRELLIFVTPRLLSSY